MKNDRTSLVDVVAGVLVKDKKFLIGQREKGSLEELKWEFPGGKIEKGETDQKALEREFLEELGINITVSDFICEAEYEYPTISVRLRSYFVHSDEELEQRVHKDVRFVTMEELEDYVFVAGDIPTIECIKELK